MSNAIRTIRQNIRRARATRTQAVNSAQAMYQRGVGDTNYVSAEVGDYLGKMNNNINAGYDQSGQQMAAARAALQNQIGANTNQNAADASGELARLGISGSGLGHLRDDASFMQNLAAQRGADEQSNNALARQNSNAVGDLLLGMNQGGRQSTLGQLLNTRNDDITTTRQQFREDRRQMIEMINNIKADQAKQRAYRSRYSGGGYSSHYTPYHRYSSGGGSGSSGYDKAAADAMAAYAGKNGGGKKPRGNSKPTVVIPTNNWAQKWIANALFGNAG